MTGGKLIKVCGMTQADNIRSVEALGVDLMGFIFFSKSPRCVAVRPDYLPTTAKRVGVFVNEKESVIAARAEEFGLEFIQLHGHEAPELCNTLRNRGLKVIKALSVAEAADLKAAESYAGNCDYLMFDTKCKEYGGSGRRFDWSVLDSYTLSTPFLLSGGIGPESVDDLLLFSHPQLVGYDLNSRFESAPGVKDTEMLRKFIKEIKQKTEI
jgi:phosphoribosylanthranilate isomerase